MLYTRKDMKASDISESGWRCSDQLGNGEYCQYREDGGENMQWWKTRWRNKVHTNTFSSFINPLTFEDTFQNVGNDLIQGLSKNAGMGLACAFIFYQKHYWFIHKDVYLEFLI